MTLQIRISDIAQKPLDIQTDLSVEALNTRMNEGENNDIVFVENPYVDLTVTKAINGATIKGRIKTRLHQPCSLCALEVNRDHEVQVDLILKRRPGPNDKNFNPNDERYEDDIGIMHFEGDHVELEEVLQEAIILSLSQYWRPPCNQKGECEICGESKPLTNTGGLGNTLGNLLKIGK